MTAEIPNELIKELRILNIESAEGYKDLPKVVQLSSKIILEQVYNYLNISLDVLTKWNSGK